MADRSQNIPDYRHRRRIADPNTARRIHGIFRIERQHNRIAFLSLVSGCYSVEKFLILRGILSGDL